MSDDQPNDKRDPNKPLGLKREDLESKPAKSQADSPVAETSGSDSAAERTDDSAPSRVPTLELTSSPNLSSFAGDGEAQPEAASEISAEFERPGGLLSKIDGHLVMYHDPSSVQAEQYRACRTRLTAMNRVGAPWALVVASSRSGEGRSMTAANLAVCLAELPDTRVCLLEVDGRSLAQAEIFGVRSQPGTHDLLEGRAALKDVLRTTLLSRVDVIPAGLEPDNPAELLGSDKFVRLLEDLKRRYSWVLIDAPPVHPFTDACVVTPLTDGALVVVRLGETPRELVTRTIENIEAAGGRVLGSFVTGQLPGVDDEERLGEYGYDVDSDTGDLDRSQLSRDRKHAEKRLRKQERAHLKSMQRVKRRDDMSEV